MTADGSRLALALVLGTVGMAMFAGTLPALRVTVPGLDADFIAYGRAVTAGVLAVAVLAVLRPARPVAGDWAAIAVIALCLVLGFPILTAFAMERVPASHGGAVLAILPLATTAAATVFGGERPPLSFWLLSLLGGLLVIVFTLSEAHWSLLWGDAFLLAAAAVGAVGYALSGRLARTMPGWAVNAWALVVALPVMAAAAVWTAPAAWPTAPSVWAGFLYLGVVSMFLGFFFWNTAMAMGGIAKIGQLQLLSPFVTMALAIWIAGEAFDLRLVVFAALVVAVVAAAQRITVRRAA